MTQVAEDGAASPAAASPFTAPPDPSSAVPLAENGAAASLTVPDVMGDEEVVARLCALDADWAAAPAKLRNHFGVRSLTYVHVTHLPMHKLQEILGSFPLMARKIRKAGG